MFQTSAFFRGLAAFSARLHALGTQRRLLRLICRGPSKEGEWCPGAGDFPHALPYTLPYYTPLYTPIIYSTIHEEVEYACVGYIEGR